MGRIVAVALLASGLIAGAAVYYLQVYAFYDDVSDSAVITLDGAPLALRDLRAIDSESSPIRFRACFQVDDLPESTTFAGATPLTSPKWFDCFDAGTLTAALRDGRAVAYLSETEIRDGVDRVIAVFPDGRGFAWHQLNEKYRD
jgi:hypothetical protein